MVLFAAVGLAAIAAAAVVDRIAATVNDVAIPESEVRKAMVVAGLPREAGESDEAYRGRILDALVDQHLQYEDAQRFGPAPPDAAEIEAAMTKLSERLRAEGKDPQAEFTRAGLTREEVRASIERQLLIQRYLRERFTPIAIADETRAREEYDDVYTPERSAAGLSVPPFESVVEEMRKRAQDRVFTEEIDKWRRELRVRARVGIYRIPVPVPVERQRVVLSAIEGAPPAPTMTPTSHPTPTPAATPVPATPTPGLPAGFASAGRPGHRATPEKVKVQVEDGLAGPFAVVDDEPVVGDAALPGDRRRPRRERAQERFLRGRGLRQSTDVLARDHEDVSGRLRRDVFEGEDPVVLEHLFRRDFTRHDPAEDAVAQSAVPPATRVTEAPSAVSFSSIRA